MRHKLKTVDELRAMTAPALAAECLRFHDPDTLIEFWQLTGMLTATLQKGQERNLASIVMAAGRTFDDAFLVKICQCLCLVGEP